MRLTNGPVTFCQGMILRPGYYIYGLLFRRLSSYGDTFGVQIRTVPPLPALRKSVLAFFDATNGH